MLNYAEARDHLSVAARLTRDDPFLTYLLKMAERHCRERDKENRSQKIMPRRRVIARPASGLPRPSAGAVP